MKDVDVRQFEKRIKLRVLKPEDYEAIVALQRECFPDMKTWTREQFDSLIKVFPEGQLCITLNRKIIASSSSLIVDLDEYHETHTWRDISGQGYATNHDPHGDTLYGIEIMVAPKFRGYKLSRRLYNERKKFARKLNLRRIVLGGRIPAFHKYADKMSARKYVEKVLERVIYDPVLTAQIANGFVLKRLIPEYLPGDKESKGFATLLEWTNLDYIPGPESALTPLYVRVCAVQYMMRMIKNFDDFAEHSTYFVDVASDYKCDFIMFPEMFTTQLLSFFQIKRPAKAMRALSEFTPRYLDLFTKLAIKHNINIIGGSHFAIEDDGLYNISFLFRRDGTIGKQYKIHITPSERRWWGVKPGSRVEVFDTDKGKIAILVCYDIEFPELARIAVRKGANMIFVPFNTDERRAYMRIRYCSHARCIENGIYVIIAGCVGNLPSVKNLDIHYAQSAILTPSDIPFQRDGVAAECAPNIETMIFQDLDLRLLKTHRSDGSVLTWLDRRSDLYKISYKEEEKDETF
ncbi:MAG: bifunctional GNAT family N-acetyltransferase/carbon-nitrogen hydrolase family protein [candidate division WOR-3 bacterium]|nr:bifunctional GNAT family N-acetyltransferase/carbon-nitrogen hydrolase family protein [candidate division WOR-3 bacterium]